MHRKDQSRIDAYEGLSPYGSPIRFRGIAKFPDYKISDLGRLSAPLLPIGQKFVFDADPGRRYKIVGLNWRRGGWIYRVCPVSRNNPRLGERWVSEKMMGAQKKILLVND